MHREYTNLGKTPARCKGAPRVRNHGRDPEGSLYGRRGRLGDEVVVFIIGMRINKPRSLGQWLPVFKAMGPMLKHLAERPEKGLLAYRASLPAVLRAVLAVPKTWSDSPATPTTRTRAVAAVQPEDRQPGDVGIWHETYRVKTADIEIYGNMPAQGSAWPPVWCRCAGARIRRRPVSVSPMTTIRAASGYQFAPNNSAVYEYRSHSRGNHSQTVSRPSAAMTHLEVRLRKRQTTDGSAHMTFGCRV